MAIDVLAAGFKGAGTRMAPGALAQLAAQRGLGLAVIEAIVDVESGGTGFDEVGRPKILPEPHIFYRTLGPGLKRDAAVRAGVAYLVRGTRPYPVGSEPNYARLKIMCSFDLVAALQSTSWGMAQIMGFNAKACGFDDVRDFVAAAMDSEQAQAGLMLDYLAQAGLQQAIRDRDWARIATVYNGSGNVAVYSSRLTAAYARHAGATLHQPMPPTVAQVEVVSSAPPALRQPAVTADSLNDAEYLSIRAEAGQ